jgi:hypothetical protein
MSTVSPINVLLAAFTWKASAMAGLATTGCALILGVSTQAAHRWQAAE